MLPLTVILFLLIQVSNFFEMIGVYLLLHNPETYHRFHPSICWFSYGDAICCLDDEKGYLTSIAASVVRNELTDLSNKCLFALIQIYLAGAGMLKELIRQNRSYRRFYQEHYISGNLLYDLVDNARISSSAANLQPLRYIIVNEHKINEKIFATLRWAGYLQDWEGPPEGEKPAAYIIMLGDREYPKFHQFDGGIAAQSILLGATEKGLGGCIFASVDRERLQKELQIPSALEIIVVIALGKPQEKVILEEVDAEGEIKYWRDKEQIHHVPKRKMSDIIIKEYLRNR